MGKVLTQLDVLRKRIKWTPVLGWNINPWPDGASTLHAAVMSSDHVHSYIVLVEFDKNGEPVPGMIDCPCIYFKESPSRVGLDDVHTIPMDSRHRFWCRHTLAALAASGYNVDSLHHCSELPTRPVHFDWAPKYTWAFAY